MSGREAKPRACLRLQEANSVDDRRPVSCMLVARRGRGGFACRRFLAADAKREVHRDPEDRPPAISIITGSVACSCFQAGSGLSAEPGTHKRGAGLARLTQLGPARSRDRFNICSLP